MTRPYGGGCSVEGGSNLNVKVGQIYLTINKGHREIIGFYIYRNESRDSWNDFLKGLKACGLREFI